MYSYRYVDIVYISWYHWPLQSVQDILLRKIVKDCAQEMYLLVYLSIIVTSFPTVSLIVSSVSSCMQ